MSSSQHLPFTSSTLPSLVSPQNDFQGRKQHSLYATTSQRSQSDTTIGKVASISSFPASRSSPHELNRFPPDTQIFTSPNFSHMHSATHAGGIQPSLSFFRPTRPNNQADSSRPSSVGSMNDAMEGIQDPEIFQLSDINHRRSDSSDDQVDGSRATDHTCTVLQDVQSSKRVKQSREPLLPTAARPDATGRPSGIRDRSGTTSSYAAKNKARTSFDKFLGLSRGLSFESLRKIQNSRPALIEGRATFESKRREDLNNYDLPTHHKRTFSSGAYGDNIAGDRRHSGFRTSDSHFPDPSFVPKPPDRWPPLSAIPIFSPETKKQYRNYQLHSSNNKFFLGGRLLTGGDSPWAFVASFSLVLTIAGVWFGTTCVWWWQNQSPAVAAVGIYMALLVISTMLATVCQQFQHNNRFGLTSFQATTDPGILPRELDPDPPYSNELPSDGGPRVPMPRELKVRNET